jgi:hypothetical protein
MRRLFLTLVVILATLATMSVTLAQSGQLEIPWSTVSGGGATWSTGDGFALSGTIGQPGTEGLSGGVYTMQGGFWWVPPGSGAPTNQIYLPLVFK